MVKNQIEFNEKFSKETEEIRIKNKDFEGQLVVEDYPNLKKLYLRDIETMDTIILKNLPQLKGCTIRDCGTKSLAIENCSQISGLNIENNLLANLEFIKDLESLEELEVDGNAKLSEILEKYEDNWKVYQKDLQKSNKDTNILELLESIQTLKKEKEFLNIKYDELKKFLKEILVSLSQEKRKDLAIDLNKKINRKDSISAPGRTKELMLNTEKVIKSLKEIKKELESELVESKAKIEDLEKKLIKQSSLYQQKEIELITQKSLTEELKKQWISAIQESAKSEPVEKEKWEQKSKELEKKLDEAKEREFGLRADLKAVESTLERAENEVNYLREKSGRPTYQIQIIQQYSIQYQQLASEAEKEITESLSDKEVTPQEQKVINKTILFLGTKELFINYRQNSINDLIECYNKLEKRFESKLNKFTTAVSMTNIAGKLAKIIPGGGVAEAPIGILGDTINLTGTIIKEKDLEKFTKQFQTILDKDKKNLSLFDGNYLSLINTVWEDSKTSQGAIVSTIISTLNLVKTELNPFSNDYDAFNHSVSGIWQGRSSIDLGEMKSSLEAVINNFQELKQRLKNEKEQLGNQSWFKVIEAKTDLLQEQPQTQIQVNPNQ
jgi:DNA repair exonuclease SbcCD ATPase subunit